MKLATLRDGTPDGRLHVVSRDLKRAAPASASKTLQQALEDWTNVVADLTAEYDALNAGNAAPAIAFDLSAAMAPLPRAWQWLDGSAFESHGNLMDTIFGIKKERTNRPLMYQGVSDCFYGATDDIPLPSEGDDIDFEGEYGVITDRVPMGTSVDAALGHIRLLVQINDWSLRRIAPIEMKTGFGWVQAKPPCSMSPVAVTPDEASAQWPDARLAPPAFPIAPIYGLGDRLHRSAHQAAFSCGEPPLISSSSILSELLTTSEARGMRRPS